MFSALPPIKMKKVELLVMLMLVIISISTYGQTDFPADKSQQKEWLRNNKDIVIGGTGDFQYNMQTATLTVLQGATAKIPSSFAGNIIVDNGAIQIGSGFNGNVEVKYGSIILENKGTFTGGGSYNAKNGLTVTKGNVLLYNYATSIALENANRVIFGGNKIEGICANGCSVAGQKLGKEAKFTYSLEGDKHKVRLTGKPELPTLPNANIRQADSKFYLGESNIELDTDNKIYLTKGSKIKINGREIIAEKETLQLHFDMSRRVVRAFVLPYSPSQKNVNLRTDSKNKQYSPEAGYLVDEPRRINSRNNLNNNPNLKDFIREQAKANGLDPDFAYAICAVESSCTPKTGCNANSCGMFQISEIAVKDLNKFAGYKKYSWPDVRNNPSSNAAAAIEYLAYLQRLYKGNQILAAAAYNAGLGNVNRHRGVPPFSITRAYVGKVNAYTTNKPILENK